MKASTIGWLATVALVALVSACGADDGSSRVVSESCPEAEGLLTVSGSSTVEPISAAVGEKLLDCSEIGAIVDGPGTGDGFQLFCAGQTDISNASRPIHADEIEDCVDAGIDFIELKVAYDGISVLTSPANETVDCLTFEDLYALVGPEAEDTGRWDDATAVATEMGSTTELPDATVSITGPGAESGTYDSFVEIVIEDLSEQRAASGHISTDQVGTLRHDYASQSDDTAIIAAMGASDTPLGWVGFAFAEQAGDAVKEISVASEPSVGCVAPSAQSIADGSYPLSRALYIYVNEAAAADNEAVAGYVDYYLGDDGIASVAEVGYVELPAEQLALTRSTWETRTTGSAEG